MSRNRLILGLALAALLVWGGLVVANPSGEPVRDRSFVALLNRAGNVVNPATKEGADYVCSAAYRVAIDGTSRVLADPNVGGPVVWPADLVGISLVREAGSVDQIHFASATATTASPQWESGGLFVRTRMADANSRRVISSGDTVYATLRLWTPR